jgi:prevent-host-death family protein
MKTLSASVARQTLPDLLGAVQHEQEPIIIERRGKPIAALVSVKDLETLAGAEDTGLAELEDVLPELNARLDRLITTSQQEQRKRQAFRKEMDRLHAQRKQLLCRS